MSKLEDHEVLKTIASSCNATKSILTQKNISIHTLPATVSFANIESIFSAASATDSKTFVGTSGETLMCAVHLDSPCALAEGRPKKRRRSECEDYTEAVATARARLAKAAPTLSNERLDVAQASLTRLVNGLRGPGGEIVVQSFAILAKKLSLSDAEQRIVIAARLNAGIAIRVDTLKDCLGECWLDGLLTTLPTLHGVSEIELPLSEEAIVSAHFGNAPLLLVTSIGIQNQNLLL
tara:strand:- start:187 stop:894 length:708 start_codon:yes stop_codon:yes gene_type:complete